MQFDVRSNIPQVRAWMTEAQRLQVPFATALAINMTAENVRGKEVQTMQAVFDRPTPYSLNALQIKPLATKTKPIASVAYKEFGGGTPAKRYLNPEVHGGLRSSKGTERKLFKDGSYLVPARGYPTDAFGNIAPSTFKRIQSQLKVGDPFQQATGSRRSKAKRKKSAFFMPKPGSKLPPGVYERQNMGMGSAIRGVLMAVRPPRYTKRFPFYEVAERTVVSMFPTNFELAFQRAMATSSFKGTWKPGH